MRAGQADRQLDLDEGGRGEIHRAGEALPSLRCGRRGHGVRRAGAGRHTGAPQADLPAGLRPADAESRLPGRGDHLRSQHLRGRHRHRGAQQLRRRLHRGHALDQAEPAGRAGLRRRLQRQLLLPRQQPGARGDPLGVPLPRHPRRHGHGHRQRGRAGGVRRHRPGAARAHRGRDPQPPSGCHRAAGGDRRQVQGRRQGRGEGGRCLAVLAAGAAHHARAGQGHRPVRRGRHRIAARRDRRARRPATGSDRRPTDGWHERRRRPLRRRQDVPPAGGEIGAGDEEGGGLPDPLHRGGEEARRRRARQGQGGHGHGQGRRARHRQEHRRRRAPVQQLRRGRPRRHGAGAEDPRHRARREGRRHRPLWPDHAVARRDGELRQGDAAPRLDASIADRRRHHLARAHGGQDHAAVPAVRWSG